MQGFGVIRGCCALFAMLDDFQLTAFLLVRSYSPREGSRVRKKETLGPRAHGRLGDDTSETRRGWQGTHTRWSGCEGKQDTTRQMRHRRERKGIAEEEELRRLT